MSKNRIFFWLDRLHIQASERYFITGLMSVYVLLWIVEPLLVKENPYDEVYYEPLMHAFHERSAERFNERAKLLESYYPGDSDKINALAGEVIPGPFRERVLYSMSIDKSEIKPIDGGFRRFIPEYLSTSTVFKFIENETEVSKLLMISNESSFAGSSVKVEPESGDTLQSAGIKINLNTADKEKFMLLPGIGPSLAERIIHFRQENGPFTRIEDIMKVRGIGQARFESFRDRLEI